MVLCYARSRGLSASPWGSAVVPIGGGYAGRSDRLLVVPVLVLVLVILAETSRFDDCGEQLV